MIDTILTTKQHRALDRLAVADPNARVIGWLTYRQSFLPVVDAPNLDAILVVEGRGAMREPTRYFLSPHTVESNMALIHERSGAVGIARRQDLENIR